MDQEAFDALKSRVDALEKANSELTSRIENLEATAKVSETRFDSFIAEYNPFRSRALKIADTYFNGENDR